MNFIQFWKAYFTAILLVGTFFIAWDIYFAYQEVWGFNDRYLVGIRWFKLPLEEWLFFLFIPYSSNFIHYSLQYFFPKMILSKGFTKVLTLLLLVGSVGVALWHYDKIYTFCSFGLFAFLMFLQWKYDWAYARRFYLSFLVIYIPFFLVNSALTGSYSDQAVVYYNNEENLGIRVGTMPLEDSFYCFSLLYGIVVLFEYLKRNSSKKTSYKI